jgi:hypothetical protein
MKTKDLINVWNAPDNSRLTPKQMSIRLPLHVAAKLSALCEMFPKKTKTEIIGDLLATALNDVVEGLSVEPYPEEEGHADPDLYWGDRKRYEQLVSKYLQEMESEEHPGDEPEETKPGPKQRGPLGKKLQVGARGKRAATGTSARSRRSK